MGGRPLSDRKGPLKVKFASWTAVTQAIGSVGIALSLLFVAWELKQSRDIAEAELMLGRAEFDMKMGYVFDTGKIAEANRILFSEGRGGLDEEQFWLMVQYLNLFYVQADVAYLHYQKGLMTLSNWQAYLKALTAQECQPNVTSLTQRVRHSGAIRIETVEVIEAAIAKLNCDKPTKTVSGSQQTP